MALALLLLLAESAVAASRAAAAADLAALAAADAARGITSGEPCAVAREVALKNNATLAACAEGPDDTVQVRTEFSAGPFLGAATGLARAGPPPAAGNGPGTVKDAPTPAVARSRESVCGLACSPAAARLTRTYRPAAPAPNLPAAAHEPAAETWSGAERLGGLIVRGPGRGGRCSGIAGVHEVGGVLEQHIDQCDGSVLVERVVLVAALG